MNDGDTVSEPSPPANAQSERYVRLGEIVVDTQTRCVLRDGKATILEPRVFALLGYLMRNPGREITRQELTEQVWAGAHVVDEAVQRAISLLRAALGDTPKLGLFIETTPRGYRFKPQPGDERPVTRLNVSPTWRALAIAVGVGLVVGVLAMMQWSASSREDHIAPPAPAPASDARHRHREHLEQVRERISAPDQREHDRADGGEAG